MFLIIAVVLFPLLYLVNSRLALVALFAAIGWTYFQRTHPSSKPKPRKRGRSDEPEYQAGYEN